MSIFDEILILIDDQTQISDDRIVEFILNQRKQTISSTLGRLVGRELLKKEVKSGVTNYLVTKKGDSYLANILDSLHYNENTWDKTWFCITATLGESQRKQRDLIRHYLNNRGFGRLVDGFWIYPWPREEEIHQAAQRLGIAPSIFMFKTQSFGPGSIQLAINKAWNWQEIDKEFATFLDNFKEETNKFIQNAKDGSALQRYQAKKLVFAYASHLNTTPNLPLEFLPNSKPYIEARELYLKLRPYCY